MLSKSHAKVLSLLALSLCFLFTSCKKNKKDTTNVTKTDSVYNFSYTGRLYVSDTIHFTSSAPSGSSLKWSFGDGITTNEASPVHMFNAPGSYIVSLVVNGDTVNTIQHTLTIVTDTTYDFIFSGNHYAGGTIYFRGTNVKPASYLWIFGDGSTSTDAAPQHTFNVAGRYTVSLVVKGDTLNAIKKTVSIGVDSTLMAGLVGTRAYQYTMHYVAFGLDTTYSYATTKTISLTDAATIHFDNIGDIYFGSITADMMYFYYNADYNNTHESFSDTLSYNMTTKKINFRAINHSRDFIRDETFVTP